MYKPFAKQQDAIAYAAACNKAAARGGSSVEDPYPPHDIVKVSPPPPSLKDLLGMWS